MHKGTEKNFQSRPMIGKEAVFQFLLISNVSKHMLAD
jgi:hypothetical protein